MRSISRLYAASAPAAYASRMALPPPPQGSLPAGWLAFAGRESNPLDRDERFQFTWSSPFPGLILTLHPPLPHARLTGRGSTGSGTAGCWRAAQTETIARARELIAAATPAQTAQKQQAPDSATGTRWREGSGKVWASSALTVPPRGQRRRGPGHTSIRPGRSVRARHRRHRWDARSTRGGAMLRLPAARVAARE